MSYLINNQQKINDIIFASRNKNYGAYAIRSEYGNTVFKALGFMLLGFATIMSIAFYFMKGPGGGDKSEIPYMPDRDSAFVIPWKVEDPKKFVCGLRPPVQSGVTQQSKSLGTVITESVAPETNTSATAVNVPITNTATIEGPDESSVTVNEPVTPLTPTIYSQEPPTIIPDSLPEFEGGLNALKKFLISQLKYPTIAFDQFIEGTVYVKFVVEKNGKVAYPVLQNNVGYGLDEEAMRVVALIPKFKKPGRVNGKPVRTYFNVPIKFKISK
jgi:periplasmic protein TonB